MFTVCCLISIVFLLGLNAIQSQEISDLHWKLSCSELKAGLIEALARLRVDGADGSAVRDGGE